MGSFAFTCFISNLPIEFGDAVRYLMLTANPIGIDATSINGIFFPRTFPLRAVYNDYGSVVKVEEGPARDLWLDGLRLDMIERGWGDNTVHDVPTRKDMPFDELLTALQENRLMVEREVEPYWISEFKTLIEHVQRLLNESPQTDHDHRKESKDPLPVSQAMIREDVWQALIKLKFKNRSVDYYRKSVRQAYAKRQREAGGNRLDRLKHLIPKNMPLCIRDSIPFTVGLGTHIALMMKKGPLPEAFLDVVAEFKFIESILTTCRYQWRPSSSAGPQFGEWHQHAKLQEALTVVAKRNARKRRR